MKRIVVFVVLTVSFAGFGKGVLPSQVQRFGLTNAQIDDLFAKHPTAELRLTAKQWRAMRYELHRFGNMTNYVERVSNAPDCAKLVLELTDTAEEMTQVAEKARQEARVAQTFAESAEARAKDAEADASVTRELRKAAKRTEKNLDKIIKTIEQAKKKAGDEAEIELYEMLIGILKGGGENDH